MFCSAPLEPGKGAFVFIVSIQLEAMLCIKTWNSSIFDILTESGLTFRRWRYWPDYVCILCILVINLQGTDWNRKHSSPSPVTSGDLGWPQYHIPVRGEILCCIPALERLCRDISRRFVSERQGCDKEADWHTNRIETEAGRHTYRQIDGHANTQW